MAYPPMYGPPPSFFPARNTQEGVKFMSYYILLGIITSLVGFSLVLAMFTNPITYIALSCTVSSVLMVLEGIMLVLVLISLWKFWEGKQEFGPAHEQNVKRALTMIIVIVVLYVASIILSAGLGVFMVMSGNSNGLRSMVLASSAIGIVIAILWGLTEISLVKFFMTPEEKTRANLALALVVIGGVVSFAIAFYLISVAYSSLYSMTSGSTPLTTYIGGIFTMLGNLLFYMLYKNIFARFITGQITAPPPPMMGVPPMPGMAPMYGPQPYPGVPPGYGPPPPQYPM
jgi:MFS family permease